MDIPCKLIVHFRAASRLARNAVEVLNFNTALLLAHRLFGYDHLFGMFPDVIAILGSKYSAGYQPLPGNKSPKPMMFVPIHVSADRGTARSGNATTTRSGSLSSGTFASIEHLFEDVPGIDL
jgi:hypothetical protein